MFGIDAPKPTPVPEPEDETALRKAAEIRRRRARGGRATTVSPKGEAGGPQPAAGGASTKGSFRSQSSAFGAGLGVIP